MGGRLARRRVPKNAPREQQQQQASVQEQEKRRHHEEQAGVRLQSLTPDESEYEYDDFIEKKKVPQVGS
jgi:hypothetical protein